MSEPASPAPIDPAAAPPVEPSPASPVEPTPSSRADATAASPVVAPAGRSPGPVIARAVSELSVLTAAVVALDVWLASRGQGPVALGVAIGHGAGQLIALTWVVATALTWSAREELLLRFTLGLWPARLLLFVAGGLISNALGASGGAFLFALVGTHVWGTAVEARTLSSLGRRAGEDKRE